MLIKMDNFEKIIEMVESNPCLYDKRDEKYKDFKHKEQVWLEIAKQVNLSARECKVKWKSLRDKYRKMKLSEDQPSGSGHTWKYMESLEFLTETMDPISTNTNAKMDTSDPLVDDQIFPTAPKPKRCNDDLFNDVLKAMKRKYESPQSSYKDKYEHFFGMLRNKLDKLTESEVDEVEIEILNLVNIKINASRKASNGIYR